LSSTPSGTAIPFNLNDQSANHKQQPPLKNNSNQNGSYHGQNNANTNSSNIINNSSINNLNQNSTISTGLSARSKSPPSLHSPPMSPISRLPNSPKSPRQRHSLNNIVNNFNSNNGSITKLSNGVSVSFLLLFLINF
jgi:hypothetical protein